MLHYAGYGEVEEKLMSELGRVGLLDSGVLTVHNNISSPFLNTLKRNVQLDPQDMRDSSFSCSFGHYSIMKIAELKKYERVLVMEDDIVFLKDVDAIERQFEAALNEIPDYDLCMFSHFQSPCVERRSDISLYIQEMANARQNGMNFIPFTRTSSAVASGVAYGLSRKGLICLRGLYEHQMQIADVIFRNIPYHANGQVDEFHAVVLDGLKRYFCVNPIGL